MLDSITEIKNLCELLDIENRQYVLAAAQALKFAQQKETKRKRKIISSKEVDMRGTAKP